MSIKQIKSLVQFARASSLVWEAMTIAIPDGVAVFSLDDGAFKIGDGVTMYHNLPTIFTYDDLIAAETGVSSLFKDVVAADNGKLVVAALDESTSRMQYAVTNTTLTSILNSIGNLETLNTNQSTAIADLLTKALSIDAGINTAPNNNIVVINSGRLSNSGVSTSSLASQVAAGKTFIPGSRLEDPIFYSDITKKNKVNKEELTDNTVYYVEVVGYNNSVTTPVFTLTCQNTSVSITNISGSLFSVSFNNVTNNTKLDVPVALSVSFDDGTGKRLLQKAISCKVQRQRITAAVYGGILEDTFYWAKGVDKNNNIFCAGNTRSEGLGGATYGDCLIAKFDSNLNLIVAKKIGGTGNDRFTSVVVDSNGNVFCVGTATGTTTDCVIYKFDNNLNTISRKMIVGSVADVFYNACVDVNNNIICCGSTTTETLGSNECIVYKFDNSLNVLGKKRLGGTGTDAFYNVAVDSTGNIFCVGHTRSEGAGGTVYGDAIIVKFGPNLDLLVQKRYGGTGEEIFYTVKTDSANNVYAVGFSTSEGSGGYDCIVVKFDNDLNIITRKRFGGSQDDKFMACEIDTNGNLICVGTTTSDSYGGTLDILFVKFDSGLNITLQKRVGSTAADNMHGVMTDSFGNIIMCGSTSAEGLGLSECFIIKFPSQVPTGTFVGTKLSAITVSDISGFTLANSTLTLAASTLTLNDITTLSVVESALSISSVTSLVLEKDFFN